jgi:tetratricopeptide (TPR) repeat protein
MAHYGTKPTSLVANLYNNLGVCKMHMGQYNEGSSHLKTALDIQRKVLRAKRQEKDVTRGELRDCLLEVGDTLCNLGGIYLEWIRQQGPDAGHAAEAEAYFAEALEVSHMREVVFESWSTCILLMFGLRCVHGSDSDHSTRTVACTGAASENFARNGPFDSSASSLTRA